MKKKIITLCVLLFTCKLTAQCYTISEAKELAINGTYIISDAINYYEHKVYIHEKGTYFLHKDADTWYINIDKDSPDEESLMYSSVDSETPPLEGWKTIDGSPNPIVNKGCE